MKTFLLVLLLFIPLDATAATPSAEALLKKIDELYRSKSSRTKMTMIVETPDWKREMKLEAWTRGMKDTFIRILAPAKDRGVTTLRKGGEMWNYFPKIDKVIKVPPSMMMGSWMGSDFTNDDLVREVSLVEEYDVTLKTGAGASKKDYLLTLTPKKDTPTVWGKIEAHIDYESLLPSEQTYYDEKGKKVRTMKLKEIREFGNRKLPSVMELTPLNKEGHRTIIRYDDAKFDIPVGSEVFSLRNLQKK